MRPAKQKAFPPVKACHACFMLMPAAAKQCFACGEFLGDPAKRWSIISRNEREIEIGGRYYFAARCSPAHLWVIEENTAAAASGKAKPIGVIAAGLATRDVTSYFQRQADEAFEKWAKQA